MEHTDDDIRAIEYGNKMLDWFLRDENGFKEALKRSEPVRFTICLVYPTLRKLEGLPAFWNNGLNNPIVKEAMEIALEWCPGVDKQIQYKVAQCVLVINSMAEKRLAVTSGK